MEVLSELVRRALTAHPAPGLRVSLTVGVVALAAVLVAWPLVRLLVTVCHEAGHAVVAVLVGRRLSGIRVHSDTSGLTVSRGRPRGPGMVATLLAGYPAASVVGLGAAWLAGAGYAVGLLWLIVVLLALMLLQLRNLYGAAVVLATGVVVGFVTWYATPEFAGWLANGIAWLLLLAAPRPVVELLLRHSPGSDAAQLAALTHVPRVVWTLLWLVLTLGALVLGASWLLPGIWPPSS
ncbi:MAG: M50 family metallopeptidase [Propionicimonas sp.]|uniref:M50 family metallopeptidase n=1 Tax=Propionicimonas sp. TaxID=1955623 RepID=UPI003D0DB1EB